MTRRTEGPWSARARVLEQRQCACGEWTHCEDGVCSDYCRMRQAGLSERAIRTGEIAVEVADV